VVFNAATGEAQLTDFSFASGAASESHWLLPQRLSSEALPYISPEQTGRKGNRGELPRSLTTI
jgi:hypothetical protein